MTALKFYAFIVALNIPLKQNFWLCANIQIKGKLS